ncbi:nitronate monooxygenase [Gluconacetobacter liquefaciens]|uniref:Propionate 3-nitronate monooxygenase n=1 Tax=Gluconacetobacter liquefaciens TaxID=89584 RepID=A0A370G4C5_GLULI|nr:nitronate monooxygenase [Gluconacetobacter liquefaciens]
MSGLDRIGLVLPLIQAPMAGVATPAMAAAVSEAGGLGSIGVGAVDAAGARAMIAEIRERTDRPFNVNLFVHPAPCRDPVRENAWRGWLAPLFAGFDRPVPAELGVPYKSFTDDPEMLDMLCAVRPPVISFHFGIPSAEIVAALRKTGAVLLATVTSLDEARAAEDAGMDAVVAQGIEAGGASGDVRSCRAGRWVGHFCVDAAAGPARALPGNRRRGDHGRRGYCCRARSGRGSGPVGDGLYTVPRICCRRGLSCGTDWARGLSYAPDQPDFGTSGAGVGEPFYGSGR